MTKKDIGSIRIFDYDTKFEISAEAAVKFGAAVQATVRDDVAITPTAAPAARDSGPRKDFTPRPPRDNDAPREFKPRTEFKRDDAPRSPRANAPGSRDSTPRPSTYGDDGISNAKPYGRGEEPKGDYKARPPRAPASRDNAAPRDFKPRTEFKRDDAPRDFKPRPPRDDAPRPYSPADSEGGAKRAYKPRTEGRDDGPKRDFKPRTGGAPKAFGEKASGPQTTYTPKPRGDGPAKPFKGPKPFKAKGFDGGKPAGKPFKKK